MQFPIIIGLRRSRLLEVGFGMVLASTGGLTAAWPQTDSYRLLVLLSAILAGLIAWRYLAPAFSAIRLERDGRILVMLSGEAEFVAAEPLPGAIVHPWLCVVRLKTSDGRTRTLIATVAPKNCQNFRRLRVFLRWRAKFNEPAGDA